eukprot:SAG22_NODE_184_length_15968_cov_39.081858_14_plen_218_part_00
MVLLPGAIVGPYHRDTNRQAVKGRVLGVTTSRAGGRRGAATGARCLDQRPRRLVHGGYAVQAIFYVFGELCFSRGQVPEPARRPMILGYATGDMAVPDNPTGELGERMVAAGRSSGGNLAELHRAGHAGTAASSAARRRADSGMSPHLTAHKQRSGNTHLRFLCSKRDFSVSGSSKSVLHDLLVYQGVECTLLISTPKSLSVCTKLYWPSRSRPVAS